MGFNQIFSQISCSFTYASQGIASGCTVVMSKGTEAKEKVCRFAQSNFEAAKESELWKEQGQPLYNRSIGKLDNYDYLLLGGSVATGLAVAALGVKIFGIGALPLAAGAGTLIILGAGLLVRERVRSQHNKTAKEHLDRMVNNLDANNDPVSILEDIKELERPEFGHLESQLSSLKDHTKGLNQTANREEWKRICRQHVIGALRFVAPNATIKSSHSPLPSGMGSLSDTQSNDGTTQLQAGDLNP